MLKQIFTWENRYYILMFLLIITFVTARCMYYWGEMHRKEIDIEVGKVTDFEMPKGKKVRHTYSNMEGVGIIFEDGTTKFISIPPKN